MREMITKTTFMKRALSSQDLVRKLKDQGLVILDEPLALKYMNCVGHYRLKGYWYQLQDPETKIFNHGTTFEAIVSRYDILLESIWRNGGLRGSVVKLENTYGSALFNKMGFPGDWRINAVGWN